MADDGTIPSESLRGVPVQSLTLKVVGSAERQTVTASEDVFGIGTAATNQVVVKDPTVSRFHLEVAKDAGRIRVTDCGSTNGTSIHGVTFRNAEVFAAPPFQVRMGGTTIDVTEGGVEFQSLGDDSQLGGLVGTSDPMRRIYRQLRNVAKGDTALLLQGESGTGKELAAQGVVALGARATRPFITLDCGALSPNALSSHLFGHEAGAFPGADRQYIGAFEQANGGTLFLDEIAELPPALQPALLGVLERKAIRRVGGNEDIPIDVRLISATHRDLRNQVNDGSFRLDLYYRIAVVGLNLPPLRERTSDLPELIQYLFQQFDVAKPPEPFNQRKFLETLVAYRWPGNVRELRNYIEAFLATHELPELRALADDSTDSAGGSVVPYKVAKKEAVHAFEHAYLRHVIAAAEGNVRQAARLAKTDRMYLTQLLKRHGLVASKK